MYCGESTQTSLTDHTYYDDPASFGLEDENFSFTGAGSGKGFFRLPLVKFVSRYPEFHVHPH
jgi:hypothetical protein